MKECNNVKKYIIPGDPIALTRVVDAEPTFWSDYKQQKFNYLQCIKNINDVIGTMNEPFMLNAVFYIKKSLEKTKDRPHTSVPTLNSLFMFMYSSIYGIAFKKGEFMVNVNLERTFDIIPRTEITLTSIK